MPRKTGQDAVERVAANLLMEAEQILIGVAPSATPEARAALVSDGIEALARWVRGPRPNPWKSSGDAFLAGYFRGLLGERESPLT